MKARVVGSVRVAEPGPVTRALLDIAHDVGGDRELADQICQACVVGLDVDGVALSLLTASSVRETLCATDATAELVEDLQFSLGGGRVRGCGAGRPVLIADLHYRG